MSLPSDKSTKTPQEIELYLRQFIGTQHYYEFIDGLTLTDGVHWLAEETDCYRLPGLIACAKHEIEGSFAIAEFKFYLDRCFFRLHDGNGETFFMQPLRNLNFPLKKIEFYLSHNVLLLPSEY